MTVFLTPEGRPFFGGTYYPKAGVRASCSKRSTTRGAQRDDLLDQAGQLTEALNRFGQLEAAADLPGVEHLNAGLGAARAASSTRRGVASAARRSSRRR